MALKKHIYITYYNKYFTSNFILYMLVCWYTTGIKNNSEI